MLLPSAITCDASLLQTPHQRLALQHSLFASPPASPSTSLLNASSGISNIIDTCRSLQSLLSGSAQPPVISNGLGITTPEPNSYEASGMKQLPTPPLTHAPSPLKLRLRPRRSTIAAEGSDITGTTAAATTIITNSTTINNNSSSSGNNSIQRRRIVKRAVRGANNKRRRAFEDEVSAAAARDNDDVESDLEISGPILAESFSNTCRASEPGRIIKGDDLAPSHNHEEADFDNESMALAAEVSRPHTPKRARIAPEVVPLGLERSDFHQLHAAERQQTDSGSQGTAMVNGDGAMWSAEDDRILVELVLEKLRLSKQEWNDCARSLGKDRNSVGKRWKSLVMNGEIGLKTRGTRSRGKIHGTWR